MSDSYEQWYQYLKVDWDLSDRAIFTLCTWITHDVTNWTLQALLFCVYHFNLFPQYKLQSQDKWPTPQLVWKAMINNIISKTIIGPIGLYYVVYPFVVDGSVEFSAPVPSIGVFAGKFVLMFVLIDCMFYWSHRLMHYGILYKLFHKRHHEFREPIGISYAYAHAVEDLFVNTMPLMLALVVSRLHLVHWMLFLALRVWETIDAHCGFAFPWSPWQLVFGGAPMHDFHHSHNVGNYGLLRFWDWFCGTDSHYRDWKQKQQSKQKKSS